MPPRGGRGQTEEAKKANFDAFVDLVSESKLLRRVKKLGGERSLGFILFLLSNKLQLCITLRHDLLESLIEMLIEGQEVLLESFCFLSVNLTQKQPDALLSI